MRTWQQVVDSPRRSWFWLVSVLAALALAGCTSPLSLLPMALLVAGLALSAACRDDGTDDGTSGPCCVNGRVASCFCPAGAVCNYAGYFDCGDGTCGFGDRTCGRDGGGAGDASLDAGSFAACCVEGRITTCFCPANVACNYGWFTNCGAGTCSNQFPADASVVCPRDGGSGDAAADASALSDAAWP